MLQTCSPDGLNGLVCIPAPWFICSAHVVSDHLIPDGAVSMRSELNRGGISGTVATSVSIMASCAVGCSVRLPHTLAIGPQVYGEIGVHASVCLPL